MTFKIGIDVGGTFTDFAVYDRISKEIRAFKVETTYPEFSDGVKNGLDLIASTNHLQLRELLANTTLIVHGTTITTNTMLNRGWVKTGLVTTKGFRDVIELRRGVKKSPFDMSELFPPPIVPRSLRFEVGERTTSRGKIVLSPKTAEIKNLAKKIQKQKLKSVAICFLHSFSNPKNEKFVKRELAKHLPGVFLTGSHEILSEIREYERFSTTVVSACVQPILADYLHSLALFLKTNGFRGMLFITQSNGGALTAEKAIELSVGSIFSGPSAGPTAAVRISQQQGIKDFIYAEMGGTSFEACICPYGHPLLTTEGEISGYRTAASMIDMNIIGAGGGSIAWIDILNALRVGPQSAGADPGPACYGKGGEQPTVTDADLLLGYINPNFFLGGAMKLREDLSVEAIKSKVSKRLSLEDIEATQKIYEVINENMASNLALTSVKRGYDIKDFAIVTGGGAGPIHIASIAERVGATSIIVPRSSGVMCSIGMLVSDLKLDYVRTHYQRASFDALKSINSMLAQLVKRGQRILAQAAKSVEILPSLDIRYIGQMHEVNVELKRVPLSQTDFEKTLEEFHVKHELLYGYSEPQDPCEIINVRLTVIGVTDKPEIRALESGGKDPSRAKKKSRCVYFEKYDDFQETDILDGSRLLRDNLVEGPSIIEEESTTVVVNPGWSCQVTALGDYLLERK
jgi:N-methylhydantoinase A